MSDQPRVCAACGTPEVRTDTKVNLDPFTNYCVDCLGAAAKEARQSQQSQPVLTFDARAAAANDRGDV